MSGHAQNVQKRYDQMLVSVANTHIDHYNQFGAVKIDHFSILKHGQIVCILITGATWSVTQSTTHDPELKQVVANFKVSDPDGTDDFHVTIPLTKLLLLVYKELVQSQLEDIISRM